MGLWARRGSLSRTSPSCPLSGLHPGPVETTSKLRPALPYGRVLPVGPTGEMVVPEVPEVPGVPDPWVESVCEDPREILHQVPLRVRRVVLEVAQLPRLPQPVPGPGPEAAAEVASLSDPVSEPARVILSSSTFACPSPVADARPQGSSVQVLRGGALRGSLAARDGPRGWRGGRTRLRTVHARGPCVRPDPSAGAVLCDVPVASPDSHRLPGHLRHVPGPVRGFPPL